MITGKVKWFNDTKGFGFIIANNKDYFVHFKGIEGNGFKSLQEGQTVTFIEEASLKGPVAKNVNVVN